MLKDEKEYLIIAHDFYLNGFDIFTPRYYVRFKVAASTISQVRLPQSLKKSFELAFKKIFIKILPKN